MSNMLERIHDLYDELERQRVMLSFKGNLTAELVTVLLSVVERKMDVIEPDARRREFHRKKYRVFLKMYDHFQEIRALMRGGA